MGRIDLKIFLIFLKNAPFLHQSVVKFVTAADYIPQK